MRVQASRQCPNSGVAGIVGADLSLERGVDIASSISVWPRSSHMRDTLGGRPYEVKKDGSKHIITFYPQAKNAKNPDAIIFRLTLGKDDLKKLAKIDE